ncbi:hypothetical protein ACLOJK_007815 [Asimina triloba]
MPHISHCIRLGLPSSAVRHSVPTFATRIEDYGEIFGSFSPASKKSSVLTIPYLDFPAEGEDEASRSFDYAQVFRVLDAGDFAVSYEEMLLEAKLKEMTSENSRSCCNNLGIYYRQSSWFWYSLHLPLCGYLYSTPGPEWFVLRPCELLLGG